jgi:hypothetical protein
MILIMIPSIANRAIKVPMPNIARSPPQPAPPKIIIMIDPPAKHSKE